MLNYIQHIKAEELLNSIPDNSIDLIFTDPPYNISCKTKLFKDYRSGKREYISFDFAEWDHGTFKPEMLVKEAQRVLVDMGSLIVWCSEQQYGIYRVLAEQYGLQTKQMLVFVRTNPIPMFRLNGYRQSTELMQWIIKGKNKKGNPNFIFGTQRDMVNYFKAPIVGGKERIKVNGKSHPTQKPLSICKKIIRTHCRPEGVVLDPFAGSGTIPYAALETGRNFIAGDFDKAWVDAANERIKEVQLTF